MLQSLILEKIKQDSRDLSGILQADSSIRLFPLKTIQKKQPINTTEFLRRILKNSSGWEERPRLILEVCWLLEARALSLPKNLWKRWLRNLSKLFQKLSLKMLGKDQRSPVGLGPDMAYRMRW